MQFDDISFDESDRNLFQVDDPRLRADALKHSIVPKLRLVLNECISLINDVYNIDVLEDSRISAYPNFRQTREKELTHLYEDAYASLGGKQEKGKWPGLNRKDGKVVQLLPFRYGLLLSEEGLCIELENYWVKGLTYESHRKLFDFHLKFESIIHSLCYATNMIPFLDYGEGCEPISTFKEHYEWMFEKRVFENYYESTYMTYPLSSDVLHGAVVKYVFFYPVYDSYIQIAKGKDVRFTALIERLNGWLRGLIIAEEDEEIENTDELLPALSRIDLLKAREAAEQRVKVMPALRWRVFQRDAWKCVACGRGSQDGVILQIDHITPRSKGGQNIMENYQTLCHTCNIGKSNRDSTDLRTKG